MRILDHRVLVFNPSKFAAPSGPAIFPLAFAMAILIWSMMIVSSVGMPFRNKRGLQRIHVVIEENTVEGIYKHRLYE